MIRLKVTPVVGLPQFTGWSQVAESTSSASTRLVSVFAISGKHAGNVGRDVSDKISDFYYYDVEQLHEFIQGLVDYVKDNDCELFISCALVNGSKSVFVTRGGSVFLKRKEKIGKILSSDDKIKIVGGSYTDDDVFVLTTLQASQFLNEIEQKFSQGFDVDIIITSVVPGLHAQTDSSLSAIVFINKVIDKETVKKPTVEASIDVDDSDDMSEKLKITADLPSNISGKLEKLKSFLKRVASFVLIKQTKISKRVGTFVKILFKKSTTFMREVKFKEILSRVKSIRKDKARKASIIIGIFVIFLGVIFTIIASNKKEIERINSLLLPIQDGMTAAQQQFNDDPISSRDATLELISTLEQLMKDNEKSRSSKLIEDQLVETADFYDDISGKEESDELDVFYDLRLVKSDYIANDMDVSDKQLVLLDSEKKQVISLDIATKKVNVKDFSEYEDTRDLAIIDNTVFVLSDGIKSFELEDNSDIRSVRGLGDSNRNATFVNVYDRFVYVLSPDKRNIYRYSEDEGVYSEPIGWMKSATGLKYDEVTSFSVDGDIWISTADGQVKKFFSGREGDFSIRGLDEEFSNDIKVFTNINQENIYVLDADKNRVVILSKEGDFQREIRSVSFASVSSIAVNEKLGKIFAVSGSIIFEISL